MNSNHVLHSHLVGRTGLELNVLVGLKAAARDKVGKYELMEKLAVSAKLDSALKVEPVTLAGCCGKEYTLRFVHQEEPCPGTLMTHFTVEEDSMNRLYECTVGGSFCTIEGENLRGFVQIKNMIIPRETLVEKDSNCAAVVNFIDGAVNNGNLEDHLKLLTALEVGKSVALPNVTEVNTHTLVPCEAVDRLRSEIFFQLDGTGQVFVLKLLSNYSEKRFFAVHAVQAVIIA